MSFPTWLSDTKANRYVKTYFNGFIDVSGGDIVIRNGSIKTPMNTISFNDTTGFINFGNVYFGSAMYIFNPLTSSNIDVVSYVNGNDTNISSINSSITSANSSITSANLSISTINSKIGTLNYDSIYNFTTVENLFLMPGGTIQYEDALGNHPDLIPSVISNTTNIATNTSNITSNTANITSNTTNITTLQGKTSAQGYNSTLAKTQFAGTVECNVVTFLTSINSVSTTVFGYISTLSGNCQTALDSKCSLTGAQTIAGIKTFSSPPVMSGASITSATIPVAAISGGICDLTTAQTVAGIKTFSASPVFSSNLQLNSSLLLNAGALTLTNANLQKIQFLSTVTSDIQTAITSANTNITTLQTKTTAISYGSSITTIASTTAMTNASLTGSLTINNGLTTYTNAQLLKINNILTSTSDLQTQINNFNGVGLNGNNTYIGVQTYNGNVIFNGTLNNVSSTTFSYLDATSSIQNQLNNKGGLSTINYWTNGNNFNGQMAGGYNAGSALTGAGTEFFLQDSALGQTVAAPPGTMSTS